MIRINKYLSICGVTSRRGAEQLINKGRVTVNDTTIDALGTVIDEQNDVVKVNGLEVRPVKTQIYILLNKPKNVLTTLFDPFKRKTVANFTRNIQSRVYPVGRLDYDTDGLLLMTNDGELAYRLSHPKYEIKKIYRAFVPGVFTPEDAEIIKNGIKLSDGHLAKAEVKILKSGIKSSKVLLTLTEGHKHEVKQILKAVGHPVKNLRRIEFAGLKGGALKPGHWRHLKSSEVKDLKKMVELA